MSKRRQTKTPVQGAGKERLDRASTVTFSIRLTASERSLLADAAKFKGWTTTYLIKQAAVERAAHIINIATPRNFEFELLARRLAKHLCDPEIDVVSHHTDEPHTEKLEQFLKLESDRIRQEQGETVSFWHSCPSIVPLSKLRDATRLGGAEFVARVLDECDRLSNDKAGLPAPIDPSKLV